MTRPPPSVTMGLSPRVRGNHAGSACGPYRGGSIPACTGEPLRLSNPVRPRTVYPRVYGGTIVLGGLYGCQSGLSPRVRGNRLAAPALRDRLRSIPACTGEPRCPSPSTTSSAVYPRVYGGTSSRWYWKSIVGGLSPRVRGNLPDDQAPTGQDRSIPACTGEPLSCRQAPMRVQVYPRVYGGTFAGQYVKRR